VPAEASLEEYLRVQQALGFERAVYTQASHYGLDHACLLDVLARTRGTSKGIVVLEPHALTDSEVARLDALGVCGVRISDIVKIGPKLGDIEAVAAAVGGTGWHLEIVPPDAIEPIVALRARIEKLPVPVLFDQMGCPDVGRGVDDPSFQALLAMLRDGLVWVKLSHPDRLAAYPYTELLPFVRALVAANPRRCVFGTAWPHSSAQARGFVPGDGFLLDLFAEWVPDEPTRRTILVDNPAELCGF
jgi:predicted TIM-barrel fold metal-dependent hydrolase